LALVCSYPEQWETVLTLSRGVKMNTRVTSVLMVLAWTTTFLLMFALGQKHGRDQVYLKEVECVTHPLKQNKVLCKRARTTIVLES
jgi:hypothetical protein